MSVDSKNTPVNPKLWAKCQAEAKRKYRVHPSAYSNGYASKIYKERGGTWRSDSLKTWFNEDWKAINSSGTIVGECGSGNTKGKVKCLPASKARSLSKKDRSRLAKRKQSQDPKAGRSGAPVMVSSKLDSIDIRRDLRWDSAIDRIEQKYGLRLDSWRRLGPNQRGKPCGRGWVGLRGACKRGKKSDDNTEKIKASKVELADKIRAKKGMRDRNDPKPVVKAKKSKAVKAKSSKAPAELLDNPGILPYKKVQELGKGAFGTAILTDRGTVVKLADRFDATWLKDSRSEFEALKQFEKLGIGPKAIAFDGKTIEMGLVKGKTVKQIREDNANAGIGAEAHYANQMKAAKVLLKLHQSGWVHGDAHDENVLIDKDGNAKLIDAGYAAKTGATIGNASADTGYEDISRVLEGHPDFPKFEAAMEPYTDNFHDEMSAAWAKHGQKFRRKRTREARTPVGEPVETTAIKQKLHNAYLRIAEQFIK